MKVFGRILLTGWAVWLGVVISWVSLKLRIPHIALLLKPFLAALILTSIAYLIASAYRKGMKHSLPK